MVIELCNPSVSTTVSSVNCFSQPIIQTDCLDSLIFLYPLLFNPDESLLVNLTRIVEDCRLNTDFMVPEQRKKLDKVYIEDIESTNPESQLNYLAILEIYSIALTYSCSNTRLGFERYTEKALGTLAKLKPDMYTGKFINFPIINSSSIIQPQRIVIDWRPAIVGLIQQTSVMMPQKDVLMSFFGGLVRALSEIIYWLCTTNESFNANTLDIKLNNRHNLLDAVVNRLKLYSLKVKIPSSAC